MSPTLSLNGVEELGRGGRQQNEAGNQLNNREINNISPNFLALFKKKSEKETNKTALLFLNGDSPIFCFILYNFPSPTWQNQKMQGGV